MSELTKQERAWLRKVQKVLDECPSTRLGFYTIGDPDVTVYDKTNERSFNQDADFPTAVSDADADFYQVLRFPSRVVATVG